MNFIKKLILTFIRLLGYDLVKIAKPLHSHEIFKVGNYELLYPEGHDFPQIFHHYPQYARNLQLIISNLFKYNPDLMMIDVGANIGDTAVLVKQIADIPILCIEGDDKFIPYLEKNTSSMHNISISRTFLGDDSNNNKKLNKFYHEGTMRLVKDEIGDTLNLFTLDDILKDFPQFINARFLKVDTDGFDYNVLKGASNYLQRVKPVIFFEYDREFMENINENGLNVFPYLESLNYSQLIFYDNYGRFILSTDIKNLHLIRQLHNYIDKKYAAFPYFDICAYTLDQEAFFRELIS